MSSPGFVFAYAINSAIDFTGTAGPTTITNGVDATRLTGAKSFKLSYGIFGSSAGLIVSGPGEPSRIVYPSGAAFAA